MKKEKRKKVDYSIATAQIPSGVQDLMKVYERFQEAYAVTEQYLEMVSPKTHQSNSNQSFVTEKQ